MQEKLKNLSLRMILSITDSKTELKLHTLLDEAGIPMRFQFHCKLRGASGLRTWRKRPSFNILGIA